MFGVDGVPLDLIHCCFLATTIVYSVNISIAGNTSKKKSSSKSSQIRRGKRWIKPRQCTHPLDQRYFANDN